MNSTYKAKTVKMQGFNGREEDVVPARERLLELKSSGTPYNIQTEPIEFMGKGFFRCLLTILLNPLQYFTGSSEIKREEVGGFEAAETRSIGRALAAYGIAIENSFSSADEFPGAQQTVDPGAKNSVHEVLDQLKIVQERKSTQGISSPLNSENAEYDPNLGTSEENPNVGFADANQKPAPRRRKKADENVEQKAEEVQDVQNVAKNEPELPIFKDEIQPEVAENLKIRPQVDNPPVESTEDQPWFTPTPKPVVAEPQVVQIQAKEQVVEKQGGESQNKFGISIPELQNGARVFNAYIPVVVELDKQKIDMQDVSAAIVKLGLKDFLSTTKDTEHWELLFRTASPAVINTVLNTL